MSCKDITSHSELTAALVDDDVTCIHIKSEQGVWIELNGNQGRDIEAYGSATVRASGSATVRAYGSATVRAYGSATVRASGSATVRASGSATVRAYDSATVSASGSATVRASDSATVSASDSATVRAYDSATVSASGSATVSASKHVAVHLHNASATVNGGVVIDVSDLDLEDTTTWLDHHGVEVVDGRAVLYKALGDDLTAGKYWDRPTVYTVGEDVTAGDWRDDHECGGGLHLSPDPVHALAYDTDATRFLRCTAAVADLRPIDGSDAPKCKVPSVHVDAEVDIHARELVSTQDGGL